MSKQAECKHGFLADWCGLCASKRGRRPRFFAAAVWAAVLLALPGCAWLASPAGQAMASTVANTVVQVAARKLAARGVDVAKAPGCVSLDEMLEDADPAELCLMPGDVDTARHAFPVVNEIARRRLEARGLTADPAAASCSTVEGAVPMTACVYPAAPGVAR